MTTIATYTFSDVEPHFATTEAEERWIGEVVVQFARARRFAASLTGVFRGAAAAWRIRIGGTPGTVDGLAVLEADLAASSSWAEGMADVSRLVARGSVLFKLTAQTATGDALAEIDACTLTLWMDDLPPPLVIKNMDQLGVDIWLGDIAGDGVPNTSVTPSGDWRLVTGRDAVMQSLQRRFATSPGEWATKPDYGAGLRAMVKARGRQADLDEVANRIKAQALKDTRVLKVLEVTAERIGTYGLKYRVVVQLNGDDDTPLDVAASILETDT